MKGVSLVMKILQWILAALVPILMFGFVPNPRGSIVENLYPLHLYVLILSSIAIILLGLHIRNKNITLISYIRTAFRKASLLKIAIFLYIFSILISSFQSEMPGYAFLGHPATQSGSIFIILNILLSYIYYRYSDLRLTVAAIGIGTIVMSLITITESLGFRPLITWLHSSAAVYPMATIGLRQHLAGWFATCSLVPIYFLKSHEKSLFYWAWLIMGLIGVSLTTSSAATLGVTVAILFWIIIQKNIKQRAISIFTALTFLLSSLYLPSLSSNFAQYFNLNEANTKSYNSSSTLLTRIILYKSAIKLSLQNPIFGWGDDTFGYHAFDAINPKEAERLVRLERGFQDDYTIETRGSIYIAYKAGAKNKEERDEKFGNLLYTKAHNLFLDELYSHGLIGVLTFILVIFAFLSRIKYKSKEDFPLFLISVMPYFIYLLGWFYVLTVSSIYWIILGLSLKKDTPDEENADEIH